MSKVKVVYQIFVRNHTEEGTFEGVKKDLERIKDLGVDTIYFLPFHEIGKKSRKGTLGSPYSIRDYYSIDRNLGTSIELKELLSRAHELGLKVVMDIVVSHMSRDSVLLENHPDWFYKDQNGELANKIGDWTDICDFNWNSEGLADYIVEVLKYWANFGFDGFRCDVCPFVPMRIWKRAASEIQSINANFIWIGEDIHDGFFKYAKSMGFNPNNREQLWDVFDYLYDYHSHDKLLGWLDDTNQYEWIDRCTKEDYIKKVEQQRVKYKDMENRFLRFTDNHDFKRPLELTGGNVKKTKEALEQIFSLPGPVLIYAGCEFGVKRIPNLFEKDALPRERNDWYDYFKLLILNKVDNDR